MGIEIERFKTKKMVLNIQTVSDFTGEVPNRKSISALIYLGRTLIDFKSKKQTMLALATFGAELQQGSCLKKMLTFMGIESEAV